MNQAAFDALLDRIDAEIAKGPVPLRRITASITVSREAIGPWRPRLEDEARNKLEDRLLTDAAAAAATGTNRQAAFALQPSSTDLLGMGITPEAPCPPRPPEPPPAAPQRSWLARLLFRRIR